MAWRQRWLRLLILVPGAISPARAGPLNGDATYCPINPPPSLFSLPAPSASDPWAAAACASGGGPWSRSGPVHAWRPHRPHPGPRPKQAAQLKPICGAANQIAMTGGGAVYDISTADAPPNSNLVLRIDNRTTVTITVNARQDDICAPVTSSHASQERLDDTFLAGLNVPFAAVPRGAIDGAVATTRANTMADVPEPAGLLLFGTAIAALRWIKRRKR